LQLRRNKATTVFLIVVAALLAYLSYQIIHPFLTAIAWAMILAIVFDPVHQRCRHIIKRENVSALVSTLLALLIAVLPLVLLGMAIAREATLGYRMMAGALEQNGDLTTTISQMRGVGPAWQWVQAQLAQWDVDLNSMINNGMRRLGSFAFSLTKGLFTGLASFLLNIGIVAFTLFFFFRDGPQILTNLRHIFPIQAQTINNIFTLISDVVRATVNGVAVISLAKGLLAGVAFWVLGVHSPVLWGAVGAIASVVPVLGIALVWVPAAIYLLLAGLPFKALLLTIWGVTALSFVDNLLYPVLVSGQVRLHTLLVFFSALGGLAVFGLLGFVLGPVIAMLSLMLIEVASEYYSGRADTIAEAAAEVRTQKD
jgi:predicted PurR-regulated permease PerM